MPTKLLSGLVIYNVTPHPLNFWCKGEFGEQCIIVAPTDVVINAYYVNRRVKAGDKYELVTVEFKPLIEGEDVLNRIYAENPEALVVGSNIAAQAYRGRIVAPVPCRKEDRSEGRASSRSSNKLVRPDRFTTFSKEIQNGSKEE